MAGHGPPGHRKQSRTQLYPDEQATQQFLKDYLINKGGLEDLDEDEVVSPPGPGAPGPAVRHSDTGSLKHSKASLRSKEGPAVVIHESNPPPARDPLELEKERMIFLNQVCGPRTRPDVRAWVEKIFLAQAAHGKEKRKRKMRASSAASESGMSGQTGYTAYTGITATTATALTALHTVGGSIAGRSHRPRSLVESDESLVVHHSKGDEPLSVKERVQAFLQNRLPELAAHVDAHVANLTEELRKEVDEEVAERFLRTASNRRVFDGQANFLRWKNVRHKALQKRLDANMHKWILEGIEGWDQRAMDARPKESSEADLVFEYLTKRAVHGEGKLPSQIPVIRKMRYSYSMPRMWKDKFISR
ncbi:unnamed protein product [Durusdinium trenchii]|uniref:Uncharacterized protein n=2 Tax=Durusdinium trenchii TaxID=1381693 RepID=A0ABP0IP29_9DINO